MAETRASFASGEYTPFWLVSNIHGLGAPMFNNGYVRGSAVLSMRFNRKLEWGGGIELAGAWNLPWAFSVQQLYGEMHYRSLWISFGSRNYESEVVNRRLSSGDLLYSGNSMSIPQLRVGTTGFAPFWGTDGWFSIKAYLAYGKFTDSRWMKHWASPESIRTSGVWYCSRGLWFRGGNLEKFPLTFDIGVEMGTQFGGTIYKDNEVIKMPMRFVDWLKAFIPVPGGEDTPEEEQTNVQGNMTGEYTINLSYSPTPDWNIRLYWEHFFEDHSQMFLEYGIWKDGLWGGEITFPKNPFVDKFVFEYIATKDQTGPVNHDYTPEIPEQVSGGDSYYNHYLYGAWQNWGMSIGTPLALSPLYNKDHKVFISNNRILASHFGVTGSPIEGLDWRFLLTFSRNWGTYRYPYPDVYKNCSGLVELTFSPSFFKGWFVKGAFAWDSGKLLGNNTGGMISIGKTGLIKW